MGWEERERAGCGVMEMRALGEGAINKHYHNSCTSHAPPSHHQHSPQPHTFPPTHPHPLPPLTSLPRSSPTLVVSLPPAPSAAPLARALFAPRCGVVPGYTCANVSGTGPSKSIHASTSAETDTALSDTATLAPSGTGAKERSLTVATALSENSTGSNGAPSGAPGPGARSGEERHRQASRSLRGVREMGVCWDCVRCV